MSALLKGTLTDFSPSWPLTTRIPAAAFNHVSVTHQMMMDCFQLNYVRISLSDVLDYVYSRLTLLQADCLSSVVLGCLSLCDVFACMSSVLYHSALLSEQHF